MKNVKYDPSFEDLGELFDDFPLISVEKLTKLEALSVHGILKNLKVRSILDCSSGTGIPILGLAKLGYEAYASDISPKMIAITKKKANKANVRITTKVADFRTLTPWKGRRFDAVISTGNSLPLLENYKDMVKAAKAMKSVLQPGGVIVLGLHNYALLKRKNERIKVRKLNVEKTVQFDIRDFGKNRVEITYFIAKKLRGLFRTLIFRKSSAYISPIEGAKILKAAGLRRTRLYDVKGIGPYKGGEWGFAVGYDKQD